MTRAIDPTTGLTLKRENFCQYHLEPDSNASKAYRRAFSGTHMSDKTVNEAASRLLKNSKIQARLAQLRAPAICKASITVASHLKELDNLRQLAIANKQLGAAIAAETARGKVCGFYVDRLEAGGPGDFERLTDDEIDKRIADNALALQQASIAIADAQSSARKVK